MAGISSPTPTGKRAFDTPLNMVPFIDLLTVLIAFLLMTAVWTQLSRIAVAQQATEGDATVAPETRPKLSVLVTTAGYRVARGAMELKAIDGYDVASLGAVLSQERRDHPDDDAIIVRGDDQVAYEEVVAVMDTALENDLSGITVDGI